MHFKPAKKTIALTMMLIFSLYCHQINAYVPSTHKCILLGPDPSFIIKFHHSPPALLAREQLAAGNMPEITTPGIRFTHANHMAQGAYVLHFKTEKQPSTLLQASTIDSGCYASKILLKIMNKIKQSPVIAEVTPNFLSAIMEMTQPVTPMQWNLLAPPGGIDAEHTWLNYTMGQPSSTIAVLDTGIVDHDALNKNTLPGAHFTNAGDAGLSAIPSCMECAGFNHGTLVAGIIAATGELAYGDTLFGVAPQSSILPINVFTQFTDRKTCGFPPCLYSYLSDQINALHWLSGDSFTGLPAPPATVKGINMSLGNIASCSALAQAAFNKAKQKGLSIVVAAGNQNTDASREYPANCDGVIAVAATGPFGERASYSNWGKTVTISAPGGNGSYGIYSTGFHAYGSRQGTSLAAPHVAGIIALLYAIAPSLDAYKIKAIITSNETVTSFPTSESLPAGSIACLGKDNSEKSCGAGIVNAYKSAQLAVGFNHGEMVQSTNQ